ncbi:hypothetical protein CR513_07885, partial [Mucuna pruriens]
MASHPQDSMQEMRKVRGVQTIMTGANTTPLGKREPAPTIVFDDQDIKHEVHGRNEPMVISVVAAEYKIERVLIDQEDATASRLVLGMLWESVWFCGRTHSYQGNGRVRNLFWGTVGSQDHPNPLHHSGCSNITQHYHRSADTKQTGGDCIHSTLMYEVPDSLRVGAHLLAPAINALELDLDPRCRYEHEGPYPTEELKEIQLGSLPDQLTKVGSALSSEEESLLVSFLRESRDSTEDMPGIDPNYMCYRLSVEQGAKLVA